MKSREKIEKAGAVIFALALWQLAAAAVGNRLLLVTPFEVAVRLRELCVQAAFWRAVGFTLVRIVSGALLGMTAGLILALIAGSFRIVKLLLWPLVSAVKAVPVASFIILCLIWISSRNLSVFISFLMVLPVVYTNVLQGVESTERELLDMCRVFHVGSLKKLVFITLPQIKPFLLSGCGAAAGMAWKAGAAAEVIGIPTGSIGEKLYQAKVYFSSGDLFAWTLVIVVLSIIFEKLLIFTIKAAYKALEAV